MFQSFQTFNRSLRLGVAMLRTGAPFMTGTGPFQTFQTFKTFKSFK